MNRFLGVVVAMGLMVPGLAVADGTWSKFVMMGSITSNTLGRLCAGIPDGVGKYFDIHCPSNAPYLDSATGYLGLGTANPNATLDVSGTVSATAFVGDGSGLTGLAQGDRIVSDTTSIVANDGMDSISFTTAGTQRMVVTSAGNVGIGTTAPKAMIDIVSATDGAALLKLSSERAWCFRQNGAGATTALELRSLGNSQTHDCSAAVSNKNFVVNTTGNVGIGTTSPAKTLHVSGTAHIASNTEVAGVVSATEIKIATSNGACNETTWGTIRFDAATGTLQVCRH